MNHVVLLGDSVFANAAYVQGGPDVIAQLRRRLPDGWRATLVAVDGDVMADIADQLKRLPSDATHLVISIGGNDALGYSSVPSEASASIGESLARLAQVREEFAAAYAGVVELVKSKGLPSAFCTIYDPRFEDPLQRRVGTTALAVLNDGIIRVAAWAGVPLLDLRLICSEDADFANAIEPSVQGGGKIAAAIVSLLKEHDFARARSEIYVR
ncbi:SGNH/GDSL hydrolase family protein [Chelativorans sp.]|uniref:SGNH/GDSL hydrolase family protein n=1 Tax=Chelativorans sp. TaxID=2203393 RepID=UPI0028128BAB|nr:SGNH/GDSL hydrolase family protein [Chelativorans sp.]